jgi:hypothetical protein
MVMRHVSIDLARMVGTLEYLPGLQLPRHDKQLLERTVASAFLASLARADGSIVADLQSARPDPPDVIFTHNEKPRSMELCELVPENRFEKDAIIRKLRREILAALKIGEHTAGYAITIFLTDDGATQIRPGRIAPALARALTDYFERGAPEDGWIQVPEKATGTVRSINATREDLRGDPRLEDDRQPLIMFGAQDTYFTPERDFPLLVESRLSTKGLHDLPSPTWLLLWSQHHAFAPYRKELNDAIGHYLERLPMKYERIFHLHLCHASSSTEFPGPKGS